MKKISLFLFVLLFASCKKDDNKDLTVFTEVRVIVVDHNGNDLLDKNTNGFIPLENISLTTLGDNDKSNGKPPFYPYYTIKEFVSPEYVQNIQWSEELKKNYLRIFLDHTFSNTSTIINWGSNYLSDTLRATIIFDETKMEVKYNDLYLNEKLVKPEKSEGIRYAKIQIRLSKKED